MCLSYLLATRPQTKYEWMLEQRTKNKYIPIHNIREALQPSVRRNLLSFHAITGCDSTSQFSRHGHKSTWAVYLSQPEMLDAFTYGTETAFDDAECSVVKVYSPDSLLTNVNDLRAELFHRITNPEKLPPTHDTLIQHFRRCQHQSMVWDQAKVPQPNISLPQDSGWKLEDGTLVPILMITEGVPSACKELKTCGCKTRRCNTARCTCNNNKMMCSLGWLCKNDCQNPYRIQPDDVDSDIE